MTQTNTISVQPVTFWSSLIYQTYAKRVGFTRLFDLSLKCVEFTSMFDLNMKNRFVNYQGGGVPFRTNPKDASPTIHDFPERTTNFT